MRYIQAISEPQRQELERVHKAGKSHQERNRCQCILLSSQGYEVQALAAVFGVSALSIYKWFNRFEKHGVAGLKNQAGKGRKPILSTSNATHVEVVESIIEKEKQRLKLAKAEIEAKLATAMSEMTLKRFLKKLVTDSNASVSG
jgi:transposase